MGNSQVRSQRIKFPRISIEKKTPSENPRQFRIAPLILTSFCSDSFLRCALSWKLLSVGRWCLFGALSGRLKTQNGFSSVFAGNFRSNSSRCRVARFSKFSSKSRCSTDMMINSTQKLCPHNSANKSRKKCFLSLVSNFFYFCFADYPICLIIFSCFFFLVFFQSRFWRGFQTVLCSIFSSFFL